MRRLRVRARSLVKEGQIILECALDIENSTQLYDVLTDIQPNFVVVHLPQKLVTSFADCNQTYYDDHINTSYWH